LGEWAGTRQAYKANFAEARLSDYRFMTKSADGSRAGAGGSIYRQAPSPSPGGRAAGEGIRKSFHRQTAYGDDERRRRASALGATEFLPKPVDFDRLKAQLRQLPSAAD